MIGPDTKLGRYEIRSQVGAGGKGEVYLARDLEIGRDVAVKVLPSMFSAEEDRLKRFQQEASAAVMQYLEGEMLRRKLTTTE